MFACSILYKVFHKVYGFYIIITFIIEEGKQQSFSKNQNIKKKQMMILYLTFIVQLFKIMFFIHMIIRLV
jgi:hypothetical protein